MSKKHFYIPFFLLFIIIFSCSKNESPYTQDRYDDPKEFTKYFAEVRKSYSYGYRERALKIMKSRSNSNIIRNQGDPLYGASAAAAATFTERGPNNVPGRTRAIVVDAVDASSNTWYAASVGGGVWKTTDAGLSWTNLSTEMENINIVTLAQSAAAPEILYAGTGEAWVGVLNALDGSGVFKSTDSGLNWTNITPLVSGELNTDFTSVSRVIVSPTNSNLVIASASRKIYRSTDGGSNWSQVYSGSGTIQQIVSAPSNFNTQYAAINGIGVVKSTDAGATWNATTKLRTSFGRVELAVSHTNPNKVYAAVVDNSFGSVLSATDNGGSTWTMISNSDGTNDTWLNAQGWYDNCMVVNPYTDNIVYAGGTNLLKFTVDFGNKTKLNTYMADAYGDFTGINRFNFAYSSGVHPDQQFLDVIKDGGGKFRILNGNDGGVVVSVSSLDPGVNEGDFRKADRGYRTSQFYGADKVKGKQQYIGGMQDNGTWLSPDGVNAISSTNYTEELGGDGFEVVTHWKDPNKMIGGSQNNHLSRSTNGGNSWSYFGGIFTGSRQFVSRVSTSYQDPDNIYMITGAGVWKSFDFANTFQLTPLNGGNPGFWASSDIEVSIANPRYVWTGGYGDLYLSTDHGASFNPVSGYASAKSGTLSGIYTHPTKDSTVYVLFSSKDQAKIIESNNLGQTWTDITGFSGGKSTRGFPDVPVYSFAVMPYDNDVMWAGTDIGLVESTDRGLSWNLVDEIPNVNIWDLKVKDQGQIVIATHGRGIWTATIPDLVSFSPKPISGIAPELLNVVQSGTDVNMSFNLRDNYDSIQLIQDGVRKFSYTSGLNSGNKTMALSLSVNGTYDLQGIGYIDGNPLHSNFKPITIIEVINLDPQNSFQTNFTGLPEDNFSLDNFVIGSNSGFDGDILHNTPHPYSTNVTAYATLNVPIIVNNSVPSIKFKEVVLVELGTGSNLWDYVVVEASKDNFATVVELTARYDSDADNAWKSAVTGSGSSSLFKERSINFSPHFSVGETVKIRFKLYSDEAVARWGWAIDDLEIQIAGNNAPVAQNLKETTDENVPINFNLTATDIDGDDLTYSFASLPSNGTVFLVAGALVSYTPNTDFDGDDVFSFKAHDGESFSNVATATITVNPLAENNNPPVASNLSANTNQDTAVDIVLIATDADDDALTYSIVNVATNGSVELSGSTVKYTPDAGFSGSDLFIYKANDGEDDSNTANVVITVFPVIEQPLGIERLNGVNKVYPVPADGVLNIDVQNNILIEKIEFVDYTGKVYVNNNYTLSRNTATVDVSGYYNGTYILNIVTNKGLTTTKIIIER